MIYGLNFLELLPQYQCLSDDGAWTSCDKEQICGGSLTYEKDWRIDYSSDLSYHNWVDPSRLDLTCVDKKVIGLIGSMYFLSWSLFSIVTPMLSDRFGRKWPLFFSMFAQCICLTLTQLSTSIYFTIGVYFLVGICAAGRVTISTTYMNELVPENKRIIVTTMLNVGDGFVMVFQVIYYLFNRDSYPLYWFMVGATLTLVFMIMLVPESPKFLYARNQFD